MLVITMEKTSKNCLSIAFLIDRKEIVTSSTFFLCQIGLYKVLNHSLNDASLHSFFISLTSAG